MTVTDLVYRGLEINPDSPSPECLMSQGHRKLRLAPNCSVAKDDLELPILLPLPPK